MPKIDFSKKKVILLKPRFENTTIKFQSKCTTNSTKSCFM